MNCPACGKPMEKREAQFYWRGDSRPGWVCAPCNGLFPVEGDEIEPLRKPKPRQPAFVRRMFSGRHGS